MKELLFIPNILRTTDLEDISVDKELIDDVLGIMTPPEILLGREFKKPGIIDPKIYPKFNSLLKDRDKIRHLELLPIKTEDEYNRYHAQKKEDLERQVKDFLGPSDMAAAPNLFPYWLPDDLNQSLIWLASPATERIIAAEFIAKVMTVLRLTPDKVILFERPINIDTKLVRGTFKQVRHIHFWFPTS
ncbi:MAG: hypothetical protein WCV81_04120 [Microgenomates group bacterium]|jgi:hypothetical protein